MQTLARTHRHRRYSLGAAWGAVLGGHGGALGRFRVRLSGEGLPVHIAGLNRISLWQIGQDQNRAKSGWLIWARWVSREVVVGPALDCLL